MLLAAEGPMAQTRAQAQTPAQAQTQAPVPAWSLEAQSRLRPGGLDAATFTERQRLLLQGEQALSRMQPSQALDLFDRAALMLHAADAEVALVRTHMQAGDYRRALAFAPRSACSVGAIRLAAAPGRSGHGSALAARPGAARQHGSA